MVSAASHKTQIRLLWAGFAFLYLAIAILAIQAPAIVDERVHHGQIDLFDHGDFHIADMYLTMLPGYHVLVAAILWATDLRSIAGARLLNALFGVLTIYAFHLLRRRAWGAPDAAATLQFALLPILLPYDFLVYTDVLSLGLVLGSGAATLAGRDRTSGALMIAAMLIRQINVIWLPFLAALALWPSLEAGKSGFRSLLGKAAPYIAGVALFAAYWIWNGSISFSKEQAVMHPDWSLHIGNVYFGLFVCALLLPLQVVAGCRAFALSARARPWLLLVPFAAFALYWWQFRVDHPFNQVTDPLMLHNYVLQHVEHSLWWKAALGLTAVAALCGLTQVRLQPRAALWLYPFAALALTGFWMVEHRYLLIPFALWLAFRERSSTSAETATTALWAILAVCFCLGTFTGYFSL